MLEKIIYKNINIGVLLLLVLGVIGKVFNAERSSPLVIFTILIFFAYLFLIGLWIVLGTIYKWKTLKNSIRIYKLEHLHGGLRNLIDLSIGIMGMIVSIGVLIWYLRQW